MEAVKAAIRCNESSCEHAMNNQPARHKACEQHCKSLFKDLKSERLTYLIALLWRMALCLVRDVEHKSYRKSLLRSN